MTSAPGSITKNNTQEIFFAKCFSNSEAIASEYLDNLKIIFLW